MSDETRKPEQEQEVPSSSPATQEETSKNQEPKKKKSGPVFGYLAILFAAAFFMLLMAYLMQQRNNEVAMGSLRDSITSIESLNEVLDENRELREDVEELQQQLDSLQEEYDALNQQYTALSDQEQQAQALADLRNSLTVAEYLNDTGDYQGAAERLVSISGDALSHISTDSDSGAPSDADRYEALKTQLITRGYLTQDAEGSVQLAD